MNCVEGWNSKRAGLWIWRLVFIFLIHTVAGRAATIVFVTPPGANVLGALVDDRITFITSLNKVEIQVQNLELNIRLETQAIAAIDWLLHNIDNSATSQPTSGLGSVALKTSGDPNLGSVIDISGSTTYTMSPLTSITNRWALFTSPAPDSSSVGAQIAGGTQLTAISGGKPTQLIIGAPNYNNPNNAVTGHNPFLETSSTTHISYVITYGANSGITENTVISQARLSFGTAFVGTQELDLIPEVPEPGTVTLSLTGMVVIGLGCVRRRRRS
jgi:hypothetical protein